MLSCARISALISNFGAISALISALIWGLGGPGGREDFQKDGELRPPPFLEGFPAAGAAQTSKIDDSRPVKKSYVKNPGVPRLGRSVHPPIDPTYN